MPAVPFLLAGTAFSGAAATIGTAIAATITAAAIPGAVATAIGVATISGVATAIQGGGVSDVLKSAVIGGLTSYVGNTIAADIGTSVAQDAFFNAIDAGFASSSAIAASNFAGSAITGAITSSFNALLNEQDPIEALIKGGLTAGVSSAVSSAVNEVIKDIPGLDEIRGTVAGSAVERALKTSITNQILTNKSFDESFIESLTSSGTSYLFNEVQSTLKDFTKDLLKDSDLVKRSEEQVDGLINREKDLVTTINSFVPTVEESYKAVQNNVNTQNYWAQEANNLVPELQNLASKANKLKTIIDDVNGPGGPAYYDSIGESRGWYVRNRWGQTIGDYYFTYTPDARYPHLQKYWSSTVVNINTGERFVGSNWLDGLVNDINKNAAYIDNTYPPLQGRYDNAINNLNAAKGSYDGVLNNYNTQLNTLNGYKSELETTRLDYNKKLDEFNTNYQKYQTTLNNFVFAEAENAGRIENLLNDAAQVMSSYEADYGVKPTDQQLADLFTSGNGDITKGYASFDVNNVSEKEAEAILKELGYNPTDDEIIKFVGQVNEAEARANIADYVNQRKISPEQAQDIEENDSIPAGVGVDTVGGITGANTVNAGVAENDVLDLIQKDIDTSVTNNVQDVSNAEQEVQPVTPVEPGIDPRILAQGVTGGQFGEGGLLQTGSNIGVNVLPPNPQSEFGVQKNINARADFNESSLGAKYGEINSPHYGKLISSIMINDVVDANGNLIDTPVGYYAIYDPDTKSTFYEFSLSDGTTVTSKTRPFVEQGKIFSEDKFYELKPSRQPTELNIDTGAGNGAFLGETQDLAEEPTAGITVSASKPTIDQRLLDLVEQAPDQESATNATVAYYQALDNDLSDDEALNAARTAMQAKSPPILFEDSVVDQQPTEQQVADTELTVVDQPVYQTPVVSPTTPSVTTPTIAPVVTEPVVTQPSVTQPVVSEPVVQEPPSPPKPPPAVPTTPEEPITEPPQEPVVSVPPTVQDTGDQQVLGGGQQPTTDAGSIIDTPIGSDTSTPTVPEPVGGAQAPIVDKTEEDLLLEQIIQELETKPPVSEGVPIPEPEFPEPPLVLPESPTINVDDSLTVRPRVERRATRPSVSPGSRVEESAQILPIRPGLSEGGTGGIEGTTEQEQEPVWNVRSLKLRRLLGI